MKRMLFREIAIMLVLALLVPMFSVAEDGNVELPDDVSELEQALGLEGFEAADAVEIEAEESLTLDGLPGELSGGEPEGLDAGVETGADMQFNEDENAAKKYGVPAALTLGVKETFALKCTKKKLTYKSSSAKIAKVDAKGVVTAVKKGKATITVYSNKKKLTTCKVTVVAAPKKVTLAMTGATIGVKEKLTLMPQVTKNSHTSFTYTVKNKKIATVSKTGVVTGKKAGTTTVTVKTHNGKKATLKLTVKKAPGKVTLEPKTLELEEGQSYTLAVTLPKKTASNKLTWTSSNKKVAAVDENGTVTAIKEGTAKITVRTFNKMKAVCTVTVAALPQPTPTPTTTPTPTPEPSTTPQSDQDTIFFGHYEQDNDRSNGPELIEWRVLKQDGDTYTLISRYALDCKPYCTTQSDITWKICSLREWLNDTFLNSAFTSAEQAKLQTVTVKTEGSPFWVGSDTQDKVFLLSLSEAENLFSSDSDRICWPTTYAKAQGVAWGDSGACWWWLRSPGGYEWGECYVDVDGNVRWNLGGSEVGESDSVRPVICLRL